MHWPWTHKPAAAPVPVQEVTVSTSAGVALTQYWDRNALLLDLTSVAGDGGATLQPMPARGWPVRLEFRVRPGAMARLEVLGAQRVIFEVPQVGAEPVVLRLAPGVYLPRTDSITLRWSASAGSAP